MLQFIQKISLTAILVSGAALSSQNVTAAGPIPVQLSSALVNFQRNDLPKSDPRRYSPPATMYQNHARDYSHMLYYYGNSQAGLKPAQAQQYVGEIKKNVDLCNKELKTLQAAHANDAQVKQSIAKIEQHHAKVVEHCDMIHAEGEKANVANVAICDGCVDIDTELKAAQKETEALLKHLKVDNVPVMRKSTDKPAAK